MADKTSKPRDHYHAWICEKGHTHTDLKFEPIFQTVSSTPLPLAFSHHIKRRPKDKP